MSIMELQQEYDKLVQEYEIIEKEYEIIEKEYEKKRSDIRDKMYTIEKPLRELLDIEDEKSRVEKFRDRDIYSIKTEDVPHISLPVAKRLMEILFHVKEGEYYVFHTTGTEISKPIYLTGLAYRDKVISELLYCIRFKGMGKPFYHCKYCHSLFHSIYQCTEAKKSSKWGKK